MWGNHEKATPAVLSLHLALVDELSDLKWNRVQLWNGMTSVHSFQLGGVTLAFDVTPGEFEATVTLVVRQSHWSNRIRAGLRRENEKFEQVEGRTDRFLIEKSPTVPGNVRADHFAHRIRAVRKALERSVHGGEQWSDTDSGLHVRYAVKDERKECDELIFMFTSIRTRRHWLDFDGPYGEGFSSNRARVVFLYDDFGTDYSYHLAVNGSDEPRRATVSFIKQYVSDHGYSWKKVTLAGMSKGGSSALIIGAMLPECTVVALAPQLAIGEYLVHSQRSGILRNITGGEDSIAVGIVDDLAWRSILRPTRGEGIFNCYILTSNNDPHCQQGIGWLKQYFAEDPARRISIFTDCSASTSSHVATVHHLASPFLALLNVVASGIRYHDVGV